MSEILPDSADEAIGEAFWAWSLSVYDREPIREALLTLQNRYLHDVNLCLWSIWSARCGWSLSGEDVRSVCGTVHDMTLYAVHRLREVRRYLKAPKPGYDAASVDRLAREVLEAEIAGERLIQIRLAEITVQVAGPPQTAQGDWQDAARRHFSEARRHIEKPLQTEDELGPGSAEALFDRLLTDLAAEES